MELLSGFGKRGIKLNLLTRSVDIEDNTFLSNYFVLQEFLPKLTAGKNSITFNGSEFLKNGSEVLVECIDSNGNSLYIESTTLTNISYRESSAYILSIHVYAETSNGPGKLILYGVLSTGETVKWIGNVQIDKTQNNTSTVRFYNKPVLEVVPILSPVLIPTNISNTSIEHKDSFYSYAVNPFKDTNEINKRRENVDYRIYSKNILPNTDPTGSFNTQLMNSEIQLYVKTIQEPYSYNNTNVNFTASVDIKKVINNSTIIVDDVVLYEDKNKNKVVINVVDGEFYIKYPYIVYNTASESSSYLSTNTTNGPILLKQSFADIIYRNLKTFSGFIARHKLYRKSLFSPGDFEIISDEPLTSYELLRDNLTINKPFDKMGEFYNQKHVDKYWISNGLIQLTQSSEIMIDAMYLNYTGSKIDLDSVNNYVILKNNTSYINRNSNYYPYNLNEFLMSSGSSYDSNFIEFKKDVNYIISFNAILKKDTHTLSESDSGLKIYFTSSVSEINNEKNLENSQPGLLKLGSVTSYEQKSESVYDSINFLFTPTNDLFGTIILVPRKCTVLISKLSIKPYGDYGFSPDVLITRVPFPINTKNESFEIKAELFDINSNLVYSDLRTISTFDISGSSLNVFIPGFKDPNTITFLSGSLEVSMSLWVGENAYITGSLQIGGALKLENIIESSYTTERLLGWHPSNNNVVYTNINDIDYIGTEEINVSLYEKNGNDIQTFRLIPSILGRNIFIPKESNNIGGYSSS